MIPARGGSKGVPRKNVRPVAGRPLLAWTLDLGREAVEAGVVRRAVVSTDDPAIADVAREHGGDVPFLRPPELAGDRTPMLPVVQDAVRRLEAEEGVRFDWILLLQPTSPFRTLDDVRAAIRLGEGDPACDAVISVVRVFSVHPALMKRVDDGRLVPFCVPEPEGTRRQDYDPPAYMRNGAIYLSRRSVVMEKASLWGDAIRPYEMPEERSAGVDSELELRLVDLLMREREGLA